MQHNTHKKEGKKGPHKGGGAGETGGAAGGTGSGDEATMNIKYQ